MHRNITVWLDYRKALRLAKIPLHLITHVKNLTEPWYTILNLNGKSETITSDLIKILSGIYQGDSLLVILFVLPLNPISHPIRLQKGTPTYT